MSNSKRAQCFLIWVSQLWEFPPIDKIEDIGGSSTKIQRLQFSDGEIRFFKRMDSKEKIQRVLSIHDVLLEHGVRSAEVLRTENNERWAEKDGALYILFNEVKGRVISELVPELGVSYGKSLAVLHKALQSINVDHSYPDMDLVQQLSEWAIPQTLEAAKEMGRREELTYFTNLMILTGFPILSRLPKQLIHRDPHPGNMLFADDRSIRFLDFDISVYGIRLFDLCYLCTSQWINVFSDPKSRKTWFELILQIRQGYEMQETLLEEERISAIFIMCAIQMIFIAFWQDQKRTDLTELNLNALFELIKNRNEIDEAFAGEL